MSNVDQALFPRQSRQHCPKSTLRTTASTPVEFLCTKCHQIVSTLAPSNVKLQIEILNLQGLYSSKVSLSLLCHNHIPTSLLITTQHTKPLDSSKFRPGLFATFLTKYNIVIKCNQVVGHTLTRSSLTTM